MNKPGLIDVNELKATIKAFCGEHKNTLLVETMIDAQPTAYNVEGVIERLESLKQHEQEQHAYATVWGIEQSIEIVKGGTVDDETMA